MVIAHCGAPGQVERSLEAGFAASEASSSGFLSCCVLTCCLLLVLIQCLVFNLMDLDLSLCVSNAALFTSTFSLSVTANALCTFTE